MGTLCFRNVYVLTTIRAILSFYFYLNILTQNIFPNTNYLLYSNYSHNCLLLSIAGSVSGRNDPNLFLFLLTRVYSLRNVGQRQDWKVSIFSLSMLFCLCAVHPHGWSVPVYFSLLPSLLLSRNDLMSIIIPHCQCKLLFSYFQIYPKANHKHFINRLKINKTGEEESYTNLIEISYLAETTL